MRRRSCNMSRMLLLDRRDWNQRGHPHGLPCVLCGMGQLVRQTSTVKIRKELILKDFTGELGTTFRGNRDFVRAICGVLQGGLDGPALRSQSVSS